MRLLCLFAGFLIATYYSNAQNHVLSGNVRDSLSGEVLIGASIFPADNPSKGTLTDESGNYSLSLPAGQYRIRVTYVGYADKEQELILDKNTRMDFLLSSTVITTGEAVVSGKAGDEAVKKVEMSRVQISGKKLKSLPVLFGETDVLKSITLMPGIKSGGEGNTGIYVRGGGPDQNLVLIDDGVVYNPSHLLGFFSVFNGDVIDDVEVIKGGMPAQYGGRLSSIVSVTTRQGDMKKWKSSGGIGLISSRVLVEGPIKKEKMSLLISGRRTYIDQVARPFLPDSLKGNRLYFYDLNARYTWRIDEKSTLFFSGYFGRDAFNYLPPRREDLQFGVKWGNSVFSARYLRQIDSNWSMDASLSYNDFNLSSEVTFNNLVIRVSSGLRDWSTKTNFLYRSGKHGSIRFGTFYTFHTFRPGILNAEVSGENDVNSRINNQFAHEGALYVSTEQEWRTRWLVQAGLRYTFFNQVGPYERVLYESNGVKTDNIVRYGIGESIAFWDGWEPRLALRYLLDSRQSVKASYTRTNQYVHLATSSAATLPSDLWVPSSALVKPQRADQAAIGYFHNFLDNQYEASVEAYYKRMRNQIEFKPGAQLFFNQNLEAEMVFGQGTSYGVEFFIRKNEGRWNGWIGYTWSKSLRQFDAINNGEPYYYRYDRRHDISVVLTYGISDKWEANFVFVYGTGNVITLPVGRYVFNIGVNPDDLDPSFSVLDLYDKANTYRMPAYHRADISFTYNPDPEGLKRFHSTWNFSIYNLYNRKNPYFIYLDPDVKTGKITAKMVYLFPILPSVTWNFNF